MWTPSHKPHKITQRSAGSSAPTPGFCVSLKPCKLAVYTYKHICIACTPPPLSLGCNLCVCWEGPLPETHANTQRHVSRYLHAHKQPEHRHVWQRRLTGPSYQPRQGVPDKGAARHHKHQCAQTEGWITHERRKRKDFNIHVGGK